MPSQDQVFKKVLKKIKPTKKEETKIKILSEKALKVANDKATKYKAKAIMAGSLTRNTWLPNKNEIDIFVMFPKDLPAKKLEELGLKVGKAIIERMRGKWRVEYAQHPYIRGVVSKTQIDVVPCYKLEKGDKIISAVDRTQFHVQYLNEKLPAKASDDVRLLKQFLKAHDLYGADAKTGGFSGYLCELLIIKYSNFFNLLKVAANWKVKEIIDIENQWKQEDYNHLKKKFKDEILIVIDPVDKERNVASPISAQTLYQFRKFALQFLKRPNEKMFFREQGKPLTAKEFDKYSKSRGTDIIAIVFKPPKTVPDILWPQLRKTTKRLESILEEYEFFVLRSDCWSDEKDTAIIIFEMQVGRLPVIDKIKGPWIFDEKNAKNFAKKHKDDAVNGPFIEENYWVVEVNRKWTSARLKLVDTLSVSEKILSAKGIPNYIAKQLATSFKILGQNEIKRLLKNKDLAIFLRNYFEKESLFV